SVSLYNAGLPTLPYPSNTYPLLPITLGVFGYFIGLDLAASILPKILYFVALSLLYVWARTLGMPVLFDWRGWKLDGGHLLVAAFGLNPIFFESTSLPYTEGMGFSLTFGALALASIAMKRESVSYAILAGILAGLAYLTRTQMLGVSLAIVLSFALFCRWKLVWAFGLASIAAVLPWVVFILRNFRNVTWWTFMDQTTFQLEPALKPFPMLVQHDSVMEHLTDRLYGFVVAFGSGDHSYARSFGPAAYLVPLMALYLVLKLWRPADSRRASFPLVTAVLGGALLLVPTHEMHAVRWGRWFFQVRNGLPLILLISAATAIFRSQPLFRVACIGLLAASVFHGANATRAELWKRETYGPPSPDRLALAKWTEAEKPLIGSVRSNPLAAITRGRYHDFECNDSREQMLVYLDVLRVDYILQEPDVRDCPSFKAIADRLEDYRTFGEIKVWRVTRGRP